MARELTEWGSTAGTGAASIDIVVLSWPVGHEFTEGEVESEVVSRGLPTRGAIRRHLETLRDRGYVERSDRPQSWRRLQ